MILKEFKKIKFLMQKNKKLLDVVGAVSLVFFFIIFFLMVGLKIYPIFDASYNMLPYQNLFNGGNFSYVYDGNEVPFNPVVSTGPELYVPTFILWKIIGHVDYYSSVYVLALYYFLFLFFLIFVVLKKTTLKTISVLIFIILFLLNDSIAFILHPFIPLGEVPSAFFLFIGAFLLYKKRIFWSALLFGIALDIKGNIIAGLLPALIVYVFLFFIYPNLRRAYWHKIPKIKIILFFLIIFLPQIFFTRIVPLITLSKQENSTYLTTKKSRTEMQNNRALGQINILKNKPNINGVLDFVNETRNKILIAKSFYKDSYILLFIFLFLNIFLLFYSYKQQNFSFVLFLSSVFIICWWIFGTIDPWDRYFFLPKFIFLTGIVGIFPKLIKNSIKPKFFITIILICILYFSQFSPALIKDLLTNDSSKNDFLAMKNEILNINETHIFTYGWFQAPQLMLLSGKHFYNYITNQDKINMYKERGENVYFLQTVENAIIQSEMDQLSDKLILIKSYGTNKLFLIK